MSAPAQYGADTARPPDQENLLILLLPTVQAPDTPPTPGPAPAPLATIPATGPAPAGLLHAPFSTPPAPGPAHARLLRATLFQLLVASYLPVCHCHGECHHTKQLLVKQSKEIETKITPPVPAPGPAPAELLCRLLPHHLHLVQLLLDSCAACWISYTTCTWSSSCSNPVPPP